MDLALGELLTNVHRHAYGGGIGPVLIAVLRLPYRVSVFVIDTGTAVVAPEAPNTIPPSSAKSGRGLYLASRFVDDLRIRVSRKGHGLVARLTKRVMLADDPMDGEQVA